MSTSLMRQATARLQAFTASQKRTKEEAKKEGELLLSGVGSLGGAVVGALVDTKVSKNGQPHKLFAKADGTGGLPTNIVAGLLIAAPALAIKKFPAKGPVAAGGLSLAGVGLYRYMVDHAAQNPSP